MGQFVNSIKDQIQKYVDRGLDISCYEVDKLKEILLDIGYYRLGFYSYYFYDKAQEKYKEGIKISDVVNIYHMDIELKQILLKYINRIEINFRTKLIYYVSMKYSNNPIWFVDEEVMKTKSVSEFADNIYTEKFIADNLPLKNHHQKYTDSKYAPCWKVFEFLSFGSIITIFDNIKDDEVKQRVSEKYDIRDLSKFVRLLHSVRYIRNICAHSGVLFDCSLRQSIKTIPQIDFNEGDRNSLDASMKVIGFFIKTISENRYKDFEEEISSFFTKKCENPVLKYIITDKIKYLD